MHLVQFVCPLFIISFISVDPCRIIYTFVFSHYLCSFVGDYADTCFVVIIIMLQPGVRAILRGVSDSCSSTGSERMPDQECVTGTLIICKIPQEYVGF